MHNSTSLLLIPTHSKYDSSYTKAWTNKNWEFHQIRSFWRYQRHIKSWGKSPTARAVLPTVVSIVVWSLLVYFVSQRFSVVTTEASFSTGIASFTAPISLLLALRTNRSLTRLLEARIMYGRMVRACGSLACLVANYVAPLDVSKAILMARYLSIYGWTVKGWCREEDAHHVCRVMLPYSEATWLEQSPADLPTSIIFRLRQLISTSVNDLPLSAANAMEDRLVDFEDILGIFRRLLGSPIPPTYTRHTSRVLCLYLGLLPIALVSSNASLLSMLITVSVCSYVFVGLDETRYVRYIA